MCLPTEATPKAIKGGGVGGLDEKARLVLKASQLNIIVDDKWDAGGSEAKSRWPEKAGPICRSRGPSRRRILPDVNYDPATKADKLGKQPGITPVEPIKIAGVTIAGEPAVMVPAPASGAVAASTVVSTLRPSKEIVMEAGKAKQKLYPVKLMHRLLGRPRLHRRCDRRACRQPHQGRDGY